MLRTKKKKKKSACAVTCFRNRPCKDSYAWLTQSINSQSVIPQTLTKLRIFVMHFFYLDNSDLFNYFCPESPDTYKRSNFQSQKFQLQLGLINIPS